MIKPCKLSNLLWIVFLISPVFAQNKINDNLARVGVIQFYDNTKTKDFGYMPGSLKDAILQSMHKKFEFTEVSDLEISIAFPQNQPGKGRDESYIKKAAESMRADIIIYGEYEYDKEAALLTIKPKIYFAPIKENATLSKVSNPVDNTIFQVTDRVSDNIVKEINRMLDIYSKKSGTNVVSANDKKVISKQSLETRSMVWAIGVSGQFIYNPASKGYVMFTGVSGEQYFNRWLSGYGSVAFGFSKYGVNYLKIPTVGLLTLIGSLLLADLSFIRTAPGILALDGIALNFKIGDFFQIAPSLGLVLAIPLNGNFMTPSIFGAEAALRFHYYIGQRLRASMNAGTYFSFADKSFSLNTGLSFSYLTGK